MKLKPVDTIDLAPPPHWKFRAGTMDRSIWDTVCSGDEYRLAGIQFTPDDVVLDVGAHIGCFAWLAAQHGAKQIFCYEAAFENYALLDKHTQNFATCYFGPVWNCETKLPISQSDNPANTGGYDVFRDGVVELLSFPFDNLGVGSIRFLKLDCEGSEFPILLTSQRLDQIQQIALEYHERGPGTFYEHPIPEWAAIPGVPVWTGQVLAEHLERAGFVVELVPGDEHMGKIFAKRKD